LRSYLRHVNGYVYIYVWFIGILYTIASSVLAISESYLKLYILCLCLFHSDQHPW